MWQSILFSNNGNIFFAVWTQSGESGNTLKIKCSGTADERANIFPCLQRAKSSAASNVRWATLCLTLTKQAFRKDDSVERQPMTFGSLHRKRKAPEESPRQCVRDRSLSVETSGSIHDSPTAVPERQKSFVILYYTHSIRGFNEFYKFIKRNNRKFRKETIVD